ncbi:hypothetical protein GCM10009648_42390 [Tsukamurella spumae]
MDSLITTLPVPLGRRRDPDAADHPPDTTNLRMIVGGSATAPGIRALAGPGAGTGRRDQGCARTISKTGKTRSVIAW